MLAEKTESIHQQLNVVSNESRSWKRNILKIKTDFQSDLATRFILTTILRTRYALFANRVNDIVKIAFRRQMKLKKRIRKESMHELLWIMISSLIFNCTMCLTTTMKRWVTRFIWNWYWSLSSDHDLIEMMISCWKKMMTRNMTSVKTTSSEREKKKINWNAISTVRFLRISVQLKIADCLRRITFENSLTETKSLSRDLYMRNGTRYRRISSIRRWSRCSEDCRQSLTKMRRWLIIDKSDSSWLKEYCNSFDAVKQGSNFDEVKFWCLIFFSPAWVGTVD